MVSFLHVTDLHFGEPDNSVGIGKSLGKGAIPPARSLRTILATHDRDVVAALADLVVELKDELDVVVLTGDIATSSAPRALHEARDWLTQTAKMAGGKRLIALPGNHDRFHPRPPYRPGAQAFEAELRAVPTLQIPAPLRGVGAVTIGDCILICVDLTLEKASEETRWGGSRAQGFFRPSHNVTAAVNAAQTAQTTHVVVATHFPLDPHDSRDPLHSTPLGHECIDGPELRYELLRLARRFPVLLISGHLHRESHYRQGDLFTLVGATASQTLHPGSLLARPTDLTKPGAHAAVAVRTEPGGFVVTRWRYGEDTTLAQNPPAKRFCTPTEIRF